MPKMKTHKGASKRFRSTASGRLKRNHSYHNHKFTSKTSKRKRYLRQAGLVDATMEKKTKRLLPYA